MDESSVTRTSLPSTKAIVADEAFCAQAAALLLCEEEPIRNAFTGEPVEEVLEMVRWALKHEQDEGFDAAKALTSWARKRNRGVWSERPRKIPAAESNPNRKLAEALASFWAEHPEDLTALLDRVEADAQKWEKIFDKDSPDFPVYEDVIEDLPITHIFQDRAYDLAIDADIPDVGYLGFSGSTGPIFSVESPEALERLRKAVAGKYKIVVKKDLDEYVPSPAPSPEEARRFIERHRG